MNFRNLSFLSGIALASLASACREDKPYTPFGVASALPKKAAPSASAVPSQEPPTQPVIDRKAVLTPAGAQKYTFEGRELVSPPGRVFEQLISGDFDENGSVEVAAWTLPAPDAKEGSAGELWLYSAEVRKKLLDFPAFVPTDAGCKHTTNLSQPGVRMLLVDVQASCSEPRLARTPTRALALVDPRSESPSALRFGLRVADPAPGEQLAIKLAVKDEDADGKDDFRLNVALSRQGSPLDSVAASFLWLDRAAGISRDTREPARSIEGIVNRELARAKQKKTAKSAETRVELVRRLLGSICAEGQVPRLFDWDGTPLHCAPLGPVIDGLAATEVRSALALSDPPRALFALLRDGWYFGSMGEKQRTALTKEVEKHLTRVAAARITLGARPRKHAPPAYSPLSFEPDGSLLLQSEGGLFRLAPDAAREELVDPSAGLAPWPLEVRTPSGAPLIAVSYSCDRSEVSLLVAAANPMESTELLAPRPGVCSGRPFSERVPNAPISSEGNLRLLIAGSELGGPVHTIPRGSARSRDGKQLTVSTPLGLFVRGPLSAELWQIDGWRGGHGCVVSNDGRRAACIHADKAELYLKASPTSAN